MDTDRNLLFGVLALQADLLDAAQFAEACTAWTARKGTPLADLLVERGWLTAQDRDDIQRLLERKLKKHGGDAHASLAAVAGPTALRALAGVPDPGVQQTLATLPPPEQHAAAPAPAGRPPGRERYTLIQLHAQGGIGRVWLARDEDLGREVAVKELRPDFADAPAVVARFLEEARVTGQLEHPGIVPVHELARRPADGRAFYSMRFVKGRTLHDAIRDYHGKCQAGKAGPLDLRQLLTAFVAVCNAVAYANSRGVLHRDLKPQNIALGDFGEVFVLDWGLARVLDQDDGAASLAPVTVPREAGREATLQGQVLGTPSYMAPEQAEGKSEALGRHTDVYGLGAILYEILSGEPPFTGPNTLDILMRVVSDRPVRPRQWVAATPPALEAVCLKALAKSPKRRYASAKELAQEIERWLAGEPVRAHPEPWPARLARWGRRHQKLVTGGAALLVTAVLALAVGLWAVDRERKVTEAANTRERAARAQAEANFTLAQKAVDQYLNAVTEDRRLKETDFFALRQKLLETAVPFYQQLAGAKVGDPEQQAARGRAYGRLAFVRQQLGEKEAARADYERMRDVFAQLAADCPSVPDYRADLAHSHYRLGGLRAALGKATEAEAEFGSALALQEQLVADCPAIANYRRQLAHSRNDRGLLLTTLGKWPEAEAEFRKTLALREQLAAEFPTVPEYRRQLAVSHNNLAAVLTTLGRRPEAETAYRRALSCQEQLAAQFPTVPEYRRELAVTHLNQGQLLAGLGKWPEAETHYRRAIDLEGQLAAAFPRVPEYRRDLAHSHDWLGMLLTNLGKWPEGEMEYRKALALREKLAAEFPAVPDYREELAAGHNNLGLLLAEVGKRPEAEAAHRRALALREKLVADHPTVPHYRGFLSHSHNNLGALLDNLGRWPEAEAEYRRAIALREKLVVECPTVVAYRQELASARNNLALVLAGRGKRSEAEAEYRRALAVQEQLARDFPAVPDYAVELGGTCSNLADLVQDRGEAVAALDWYARAIAILRPVLAKEPRQVTARRALRNAHWGRAKALGQLGRQAAAAADWEQAIALNDEKFRDSELRLQRLASVASVGQHSQATAAVEELLKPNNAENSTLYAAACVYALAAAQAANQAPPHTNSLRAEQYAQRAVALLRQAVQKGWKNVAHMKKDAALDGLRPRPDFQQLLAESEATPPGK
jgi:tetratricopeptide (TPR) repeat protein/tRNA A-37 threonylcarbamoyl transferase component Bud32